MLAICCFCHMTAMIKCLKMTLVSINKKAHHKIRQVLIRNQLLEFVQYHSRAKQLSETISIQAIPL